MGCTKCIHGGKAFRQTPCHQCYKTFLKTGKQYSKFETLKWIGGINQYAKKKETTRN